MPNLDITSSSPYARAFNNITVTGTADAGVTVKVMIISPGESIDTQSEFNTKYNTVSNKASETVQAGPIVDETRPVLPSTWTVRVPVNGLTAGTQYTLYASNGSGKVESQSVTFS
jgi:hypothetical protein